MGFTYIGYLWYYLFKRFLISLVMNLVTSSPMALQSAEGKPVLTSNSAHMNSLAAALPSLTNMSFALSIDLPACFMKPLANFLIVACGMF